MTGGTIAAFVLYGGLLAGAFGALVRSLWRPAARRRRVGAAQRIADRRADDQGARPTRAAARAAARRSSTFENVDLPLPDPPGHLGAATISPSPSARARRLAVVGPSGAGKTTLFQLAQRFYDPQAGRVLLDGVDLRDADPADVRAAHRHGAAGNGDLRRLGARQSPLRQLGRERGRDLWQAARDANAEDFLRALPEGLDTFMGEGGARLSGGQRQRIAIARALLRRDAPLLLLDEATSALDAESERLVQDALDRLMADRTTIVIAHRLATVRAADRIVVMDHGRIVEEGNHARLTAAGGLYARLARLQFDGLAA